jgi:hypothetical protein
MALNSYVRDTAKVRDFIEEVAKCQTHFAFLELQKKGATPKGCAKSTKGGGWRRQTLERSELHRALTVEGIMATIFVRRKIFLCAAISKLSFSGKHVIEI